MRESSNRFTGGDSLTGILAYYNKILTANEFIRGYNSYRLNLSDCNSGISFGYYQMDMSEEPTMRTLFTDIINNAVDDQGNRIFSEHELNDLQSINVTVKGTFPEKLFGSLLEKVNIALSSQYGKLQIDNEYVKQLDKRAAYISRVINLIANQSAQKFYLTLLGRGLLFDYHNTFYLSMNGTLKRYIDGLEIIAATGNTLRAEDNFVFDDHKIYMINTKYAIDNLKDVLRKMNNICNIVETYFPYNSWGRIRRYIVG